MNGPFEKLAPGKKEGVRAIFCMTLKGKRANKTETINKRTEIERFDWFVERIQTHVALGWLSERSGEKTSCTKTF